MNHRLVGKYLGYLLIAEALFLLPCFVVSLLYREYDTLLALTLSWAICAGCGALLALTFRKADPTFYTREGFVIAGLGWLVISLFGALPFYISREIPHYIDAFFETVSGFTTTGSSILTDVEAMSHGLLFWRSFTHWLGGIGVLAFVLAVVQTKGGIGSSFHVLRAESPGPIISKMMPKLRESVRALLLIYSGLSIINLIFLLIGKMPLFDAFCTMFGTAGTGGFGFKNDSMASYSPYLQTVCTVFMAIFGVNFSIYHLFLRKEWRAALKDEELHVYLIIFFGAILSITLILFRSGILSFGQSLHHTAFTVSSIMTTTGYSTVDFDLWPQTTRAIILTLMIAGAMAGSTGGGLKSARILILVKSMKAGMHRLLHPRSVKTLRINQKPLEDGVVQETFLYLCVYCCIAIASFILVSVDGFSMDTNLSAVLSCFNNIGPGLGTVGPASNFSMYSDFSKIILSLNMLLGRLELFPILILALPSTWRRKA